MKLHASAVQRSCVVLCVLSFLLPFSCGVAVTARYDEFSHLFC